MADKKEEIEAEIAELNKLRERAAESGQPEWAQRIDVRLAKLREKLADLQPPK